MQKLLHPYMMDTQAFRGFCRTTGDALGHRPGHVLGGKDPLAGGQLLQQQLGELPQQLGAEHQVHVGEGLAQPLGHVLLPGHAAADADHLPRVAALGVGQGPHVAEHPVLGVFPDGAGVHSTRSAPSSVSEKA